MTNEYLPLVGFVSFVSTIGGMCIWAGIQNRREWAKGDLQLYREVYGPAGKPPKPATAEPEAPKQSAE